MPDGATVTITSSHGERDRARRALTRIAAFFATLRETAEQLTDLDRWYRILSHALVKYLKGANSTRHDAYDGLTLHAKVEMTPVRRSYSAPTAGIRIKALYGSIVFQLLLRAARPRFSGAAAPARLRAVRAFHSKTLDLHVDADIGEGSAG